MPKIISKATVHFRLPSPKPDVPDQEHLVKVSPDPQEVPAWVLLTEHFLLLKKDGTVIPADSFQGPNGAHTPEQLSVLSDEALEKLENDLGNEFSRRDAAKKDAAAAAAAAKKTAEAQKQSESDDAAAARKLEADALAAKQASVDAAAQAATAAAKTK